MAAPRAEVDEEVLVDRDSALGARGPELERHLVLIADVERLHVLALAQILASGPQWSVCGREYPVRLAISSASITLCSTGLPGFTFVSKTNGGGGPGARAPRSRRAP